MTLKQEFIAGIVTAFLPNFTIKVRYEIADRLITVLTRHYNALSRQDAPIESRAWKYFVTECCHEVFNIDVEVARPSRNVYRILEIMYRMMREEHTLNGVMKEIEKVL